MTKKQELIEAACQAIKEESQRLFVLGRPLDLADLRDTLVKLSDDIDMIDAGEYT